MDIDNPSESQFAEMGVDARCIEILDKQDITRPTPIQAQAIPTAMEGEDVIAVAQTGTGKTLAYTLPALTRLAQGKQASNRMLVIAPTRELALQVEEVIDVLGAPLKLKSVCVYGGVSLEKQATQLRRGCAIIVATPGRLLDHIGRGNLHLQHIEIFVMDEADRMLDMGFLPDIRRIMRELPKQRQTLMFSATFPREIERLARDFCHDPVRIDVGAIAKPVDTVNQILYPVKQEDKAVLLRRVLDKHQISQGLIFLRTKSRTERVAQALHKAGIKVRAIHGDRSQRQRQQALREFRDGKAPFLVATDVAARGLDIDGVTHVINYDIPENPDDYIHRIGRTARASREGDAITFVSPDDHTALEAIERALGKNLPLEDWDAAVPILRLYKEPGSAAAGKRGATRRKPRGLFRRR